MDIELDKYKIIVAVSNELDIDDEIEIDFLAMNENDTDRSVWLTKDECRKLIHHLINVITT